MTRELSHAMGCTRRMSAPFVLALVIGLAGNSRADPPECTLYGVTSVGKFLEIDRTTGAATHLGTIDANRRFGSMTSDSSNQIFTISRSISGDDLIHVDPVTPSASTVYLTLTDRPEDYSVTGMSFNSSDELYVVLNSSGLPSLLATVDMTTGQISLVGSTGETGMNGLQGLAFDETDTLYAMDVNEGLCTLDPATGLVDTIIGGLGIGSDDQAIEFCDGQLYGARANLLEINPATGEATLIGPTGFPHIHGLAAVTEACADSPQTMTFSIDYQSLSVTSGTGIEEGDILTVNDGLPELLGAPCASPGPPTVVLSGQYDLGIIPGGGTSGAEPCPPFYPCNGPEIREVDALSYGWDGSGTGLWFSVEERAVGIAGTAPDVASEGAGGPQEASADVFEYLGPAPEPAPGGGTTYGNVAVVDGDAVAPSGAPGIGLLEPNPPNDPWVDFGDRLDAFDFGTPPSCLDGPIYLSLRGAFSDPEEWEFTTYPSYCPWMSTSCINGYWYSGGPWSGADILVWTSSGGLSVWAHAASLGLDPDSDDIDALAIYEDGDGQPEPGDDDLIFFSVKRESILVGQLDSRLGRPIGQGDILRVPALGATPEIWVTAEALGLAFSSPRSTADDDLDALDSFCKHYAGDTNCDGQVNFDDIGPFVLALSGQAGYETQYPHCNWLNADCNGDEAVNFDDIDPLIWLLAGAPILCP
jgi:hypothetical protein